MKNIIKATLSKGLSRKASLFGVLRKNVFLRQYAFKIVYLVSFIPLLLFTEHRLHRMRF